MAVKSLHHVGIAVQSIDDHKAFYEGSLGLEFEGLEDVPSQKVRVAFFRAGDVRLELLEPTSEDSTIAKFIEKRGQGLHHLAFAVEDIQDRIAELRDSGLRMIDESSRTGSHHMQIAFLHPKSSGGVLTELCEPPKH